MEWIEFLRINVNDDYNGHMKNDCDVQDQLRTVYRLDYWLNQRKWWWAIFLFAFQLLLTDAYVSYCRVMELAGVPKKLSHYEFLYEIAIPWIDLHKEDIRRVVKKAKRCLESKETAAITLVTLLAMAKNVTVKNSSTRKRQTKGYGTCIS
jgi:hypothetical protein